MKKTKKKQSNIVDLGRYSDDDLMSPMDTEMVETLELMGISVTQEENKNAKTRKIIKKKVQITKKKFEKIGSETFGIETIDVNDERNADRIENIFKYENNDILVIVDKNMKVWCKAKDVALYLGYSKTKDAISKNVSEKYKKSYAVVWPSIPAHPLNIDKKTIFVSEPGILQLIARSRKPNAEKFLEWLAEEVIPKILSEGTYTLPIKKSDIQRLKKSFYDDNESILSDYKGKLVVYLAYIGKYKNMHILKFGKSNDFVKRELDQHRKMYKEFVVLKIWPTLANDLAEEHIKVNFASKNMQVILTRKELGIDCKEAIQRELISLNEINDLDYCINMIDTVVANTKLPQENKYLEEIRETKHKVDLLTEENTHLKELLASVKETNHQLKKSNHNLENTIKDLRRHL